jgi:hypothetical protein
MGTKVVEEVTGLVGGDRKGSRERKDSEHGVAACIVCACVYMRECIVYEHVCT